MRILFIGGYPYPGSPHINIFNQRAVQSLATLAKVEVITHRVWKPGRPLLKSINESEFIRVHHLAVPHLPVNNKLVYPVSMALVNQFTIRYLGRVIRSSDLIHSVGASYAGLIGAFLKSKFNQPHIVQLIGSDINSDIPQLRGLADIEKLPEGVNHIVANSYDLLAQFNRIYPKNTLPQTVIYRGTDIQRFIPASRPHSNDTTFLFLGGLPLYKGLIYKENTKGGVTLMEAWQQLDSEVELTHERVFLIFAGPDSDCKRVQQWRAKLRYPYQVVIRGVLTPDEVKEEYLRASAVLIPSMEEGLPNVLVEASASGVMAIGTSVGGIPEVVVDKETGLLVDAGNSFSLFNSMLWVVKHPEQATEMGIRARQRIEKYFDHSSFAEKYFSIYQELLRNTNC